MLSLFLWLNQVAHRDEQTGQGLVEYTLLLGLITLVAIASVTTLGETIVTRLYGLGTSF